MIIIACACIAGVGSAIATGTALAWSAHLNPSTRGLAIGSVYALASFTWMMSDVFTPAATAGSALSPTPVTVAVVLALVAGIGFVISDRQASKTRPAPPESGVPFGSLLLGVVGAIVIGTAGQVLLGDAAARAADATSDVPVYRLLSTTAVVGPLIGGWLAGHSQERTWPTLAGMALFLAALATGFIMAGGITLGVAAGSILVEIASVPLVMILLGATTTAQQRLFAMLVPICLLRIVVPWIYPVWLTLDPGRGALTGIGLSCGALLLAAFLAARVRIR